MFPIWITIEILICSTYTYGEELETWQETTSRRLFDY